MAFRRNLKPAVDICMSGGDLFVLRKVLGSIYFVSFFVVLSLLLFYGS